MFGGFLRKFRTAAPGAVIDSGQGWIGSGNALLGEGKLEEALAAYRQAMAARPDSAPAHVNAGYVLQELGRHGEAQAILEAAVTLDARNIDAQYLLGKSLLAQEAFEGAAARLREALNLNPAFAFAHADLAKAQEGLGQVRDAIHSYERVIACDPELGAGFGIEIARLLVDSEQWEAALSRLDSVPDDGPRWKPLRSAALNGLGQSQEALALLNEVLREHPDDLQALHVRGNVLFGLQRYRETVEDCERLLSHQPDVVEVLSNCGAACQKLGERTKARALLERALSLRPEYAHASYNLGVCLLDLGDCRAAIDCSDRALAFHPDDANLHWIKAVGHLLLGELGKAWPEHEWRWDATALGLRSWKPATGRPRWTGAESPEGKTILLTAEQGLGDTIQFARYAALLARRGGRVLLRVPQVLEPLFADFAPGCEVSPDGAPLPAFDLHCPLLSLPMAFSTELDTIPAEVPYLRSDPARRAHWAQRLGPARLPRVGLVWSGNPAHKNDANRSIELRRLLQALPRGLQWVSLQKELRAGDDAVLAEFGVVHVGPQLETFGDTAALIDCMDVVLSVDTSVAHLAGALAKPLWLLLPYLPDWRWMLGREDSPWYPTARLFRQQEDRGWDSVLQRVAAGLDDLRRDLPVA